MNRSTPGQYLLAEARRQARDVIAVVGTKKHVGKTTLMRALFEQAHRDHGAAGIFSLGRDGEIRDAFDAREKPLVYLRAGMLAVVSRSALRAGLAVACCELLPCVNALGELIVIRALADVAIAITGPPSGAALVVVVEALRRHGAQEIFVDGALDRIAPFAMIDPAFVVVSGMAAFADVDRVCEYLKLFTERLSLSAVPNEIVAYELGGVVDAERIRDVLAQQTLRDIVIDDPLRMTHEAFVVARRRCSIWSRKRYTVIACATSAYAPSRSCDPQALTLAVAQATQLPTLDALAGTVVEHG